MLSSRKPLQANIFFVLTYSWKRLKAGGEGDDRGWDGWMASPMQWTWVWVTSGSWWWTGRPGMLQTMESQRAWHDWATELIVDLQCFVSFKYTAKWVSYTHTHTHTHTRGFPGGASVKDPTCLCWRHKGWGFNSSEEGHGNQLQNSCLENPMDGGIWQAIVHGGHKVRHN